MPKDKISDYSATANSNTDIGGVNIDEGCAPSGINDAIRTLMKQLKDFQQGTNSDSFNGPVGSVTPAAGAFTTLSASGVASFAAGSASAPALTRTGDTNTGIFFPAADTVGISTGGTERARVDSSGNLGLGVTPSAWATYKAMEIGGAALSLMGGTSGAIFGSIGVNWYFDGSNRVYKNTSAASYYNQSNGAHTWFNAPSGTAGNAISFTQAMTLDASGNLLVGATSATYSSSGRGLVEINGSSTSLLALKTGGAAAGYLYHDGTALSLVNTKASYIQFTTNGIDAARIDSSGNLLVGYTSSGSSVSKALGATGYITKAGLSGGLSAAGNCFNIQWTGNANLWIDTTNLGTIQFSSDYRIKKNIQTQTASGLDRVMQLRPVTYELADYGDLFKADGVERDGFIAHEVQEVIPSGAEGQKDAENQIQNLRIDAILAVAVKAIQEQQALITSLTERLTALENK